MPGCTTTSLPALAAGIAAGLPRDPNQTPRTRRFMDLLGQAVQSLLMNPVFTQDAYGRTTIDPAALLPIIGTVPIANGGTNATSQTTNGVAYFDGTKITTGSVLKWNGTTFTNTNFGAGAVQSDSSGNFSSGTLPVSRGGTGGTAAGITLVNNILGVTLVGTTGNNSSSLVFSNSPTLVTPALGTPSSATLTNATGLPLTTGVTGTLPIANGGTNKTSQATNGVCFFNGTSITSNATGISLQWDGTTLGVGAAGTGLARLVVNSQASPSLELCHFYGGGSPGNYTPSNSGLFFFDAAGNETMRIWASDPDLNNNYNSGNLYIGWQAGFSQPTDNTSAGFYNLGIGPQSLYSITTGTGNVSLGYATLFYLTTGSSNFGMGEAAGYSLISGNGNVIIGYFGLDNLVDGNGNISIGSYPTGDALQHGDGNTFIGNGADTSSGTISNSTAIGQGAIVSASNQVAIGNSSVTQTILRGTITDSSYGAGTAVFDSDGNIQSLPAPIIKGSVRQTGLTAAQALSTYTVGSADASYMVSANILITTSTLHSFSVTCSYTDESNTARVLTLNFSQLTGAFVTTLTNALGASAYEGVPVHIRCKANTTIILQTTGTFTTVTYNFEERIIAL